MSESVQQYLNAYHPIWFGKLINHHGIHAVVAAAARAGNRKLNLQADSGFFAMIDKFIAPEWKAMIEDELPDIKPGWEPSSRVKIESWLMKNHERWFMDQSAKYGMTDVLVCVAKVADRNFCGLPPPNDFYRLVEYFKAERWMQFVEAELKSNSGQTPPSWTESKPWTREFVIPGVLAKQIKGDIKLGFESKPWTREFVKQIEDGIERGIRERHARLATNATFTADGLKLEPLTCEKIAKFRAALLQYEIRLGETNMKKLYRVTIVDLDDEALHGEQSVTAKNDADARAKAILQDKSITSDNIDKFGFAFEVIYTFK